jgi:L-rhamnose-H+ transport protein
MGNSVVAGVLLALVSGIMNGVFTIPMRFLGRWNWENVWSLFILVSCLILPISVVGASASHTWSIVTHAPFHALLAAILAGFSWGFGAVMFGQSVSAIGISLANTLVLAISSSLGSILPLVILTPGKIFERQGTTILGGVAVAIVGIAICGGAGWIRERDTGSDVQTGRGDLVGHARPLSVAFLLAVGSGILSAVFNIGFTLAHPIADYALAEGLSTLASTNPIWLIMLASGSVANLLFCVYLLSKNHSIAKFKQAGSSRLYILATLMGLLFGGSLYVYGAAAQRLGELGTAIGWPLSLATGLLVANGAGVGLGEWRQAPTSSRWWLYTGIIVLLIAVVVLSRASS